MTKEMHTDATNSAQPLRGWPTRRYFYRSWLKEAFLHAFGVAEFLATVLGLIIPLSMKFVPGGGGAALDLIWQVPLAVFCMVAIVRFFCAPYWLYVELERRLSLPPPAPSSSSASGRTLDRLASQQLARLYRRLVKLYWDLRGPRLVGEPETRQPLTKNSVKAAREWTQDFCAFLQQEFGEASVQMMLETLNPMDRLHEDSEPSVREYTEHAVSEIRAIMRKA